MARPRKEVVKEKTLQSKVSLEEFNFYKQFAQSNGMTVSVLVRLALANYCKSLENK